MITNIQNKLKFIELMDEMKNIERAIFLRNWRQENDAEHSFHLAMMVIVFIDDFPALNTEKCLTIALLHDIVEVFAGDTVIFDKNMEVTKVERERKAILQLEEVLWKNEFKSFRDIIEEYMDRSSIEAEFVHQIDKFQPIVQIVMEWWKTCNHFKFDKTQLIENKYKKIDDKFWLMKVLDIYFEKAERENMFYSEK